MLDIYKEYIILSENIFRRFNETPVVKADPLEMFILICVYIYICWAIIINFIYLLLYTYNKLYYLFYLYNIIIV